ncbi:penicillin-binding protein 2 [Nocardiopsis sp. RSe5-2]|uniref:Penicillin-binding protein 2 n=1 Tax=Nocardiopsis endophytica TaxID=3018445 RepID=A0ABT4U0X3_9ACTN|nr:penicillin-binding protein 2 [Nocardiopsis endophytica]MDA2810585.1 penicillin-binding protein 2 [Nocardiopsis endophytica]
MAWMRRRRPGRPRRRGGEAPGGGPTARAAPGRRGLVLAQVLVLALFAALGVRLWYLQVPMGEHFSRLAEATHTQELVVPATRGLILDQAGRPLVRNRTALVVSADWHALQRMPDQGAEVLERVAEVVGEPADTVKKRTRLCGPEVSRPCWPGSPYQPVTLADDVDPKAALQIMERSEDFPGVSAQHLAVRDYPNGDLAAQALGYLQPVTQEELDAREELRTQYSGVDQVGRDGLEATYDPELRGTAGVRTLAVNNHGEVTGLVDEQAPEPGMHLVSTIDQRVQRTVEDALRRGLDRARGAGHPASTAAGVVMDVRTGGIVASASLPGYDPSVWQGGIDQKTFEELLSEEAGSPLTSRVMQGQYPPASTFKVSSLAAGVKGGQALRGTYSCPSSISVGNRSFENYEGSAHGALSLHRAIVVSCNTVFYQMAYDEWREDGRKKKPDDVFARTAEDFGFGRPTGVDVPHEAAGRIPTREWKRELWEATKEESCKRAKEGYPGVAEKDPGRASYLKRVAKENCTDGYRWRAGDAVNFSIGQGDVLVTPLQLVRAYAAVANGGTLWEPRVGKALVSADGETVKRIEPKEAGRLDVPPEVLSYIQKAVTQVPKEGTARGAFGGFPQDEVSIAGKTGSGSALNSDSTAWFASYAPADDPRLAVVVVVPKGGTGGETAAPIVREIYEGIYGFTREGGDDKDGKGAGGEDKSVKGGDPDLPGGEPQEDLPEVRPDGTIGLAAGE